MNATKRPLRRLVVKPHTATIIRYDHIVGRITWTWGWTEHCQQIDYRWIFLLKINILFTTNSLLLQQNIFHLDFNKGFAHSRSHINSATAHQLVGGENSISALTIIACIIIIWVSTYIYIIHWAVFHSFQVNMHRSAHMRTVDGQFP